MLEQSRQQAEQEALLKKKNDELLKVMEQMEEDKKKNEKAQGWGFEKKVAAKSGDELAGIQDNLAKAIEKINVQD